ncbi:Cisd1 [Scenedesmus sp. PABB004]|nr:Cisd1 [Scenedesmus sp. PABB004]
MAMALRIASAPALAARVTSGSGRRSLSVARAGLVNPDIKKDTDKVVDMLKAEELPKKAVFCRCWRSKKFPYCDGAHVKHNTETGDNLGWHVPGGPEEAGAHAGAALSALGERVAALEEALERLTGRLAAHEAHEAHAAKAPLAPADDGADGAAQGKDQTGHGRAAPDDGAGAAAAALAAALAGGSGAPRGGRDQAAAALTPRRGDRDDAGSARSFATTLSLGSTLASGPCFMADLDPRAKRAPARALAAPSAGAGDGGLSLAGWAARSARPAPGGGCASWPLAPGLEEEPASDGGPPAAALLHDALGVLALHAEGDEGVRAALCAPPVLARLAQLLAGPDLAAVQGAAHAVWFASRSEALRGALRGEAALLPALLALLGSDDVASARAAAFAVNNLCAEREGARALADAGGVAALVEMLRASDALGQEAAAAALAMMASEEDALRAAIVHANGVRELVAVLEFGGPAAQQAAAAALENLSLDAESELALAAEGAVEGLLAVLRDGTADARAAAAGALRNLAVNEALEGHLLSAGCVPALLALVAAGCGEDLAVRTAAVEALRNIAAGSPRAGDALLAAGGAGVLVDAARSLPSAPARCAALAALLVLSAATDGHRRAIAAAGAGGVLVHAALSGSPLGKELAARALANLSAVGDGVRLELLREGAATVLAHLLRVQVAALAAPGAADVGGGGRGCALAAARALQNLSRCRPGCSVLLDAGCLPPLAAALGVRGLVASAAASALARLCMSSRSVHAFVACGGGTQLAAALATPKHLTPRGQRQAARLTQRLRRVGVAPSGALPEEAAAPSGAGVA